MEFFKVLGDIRANRSNFRQWEEDEANKDARRKALHEMKPPSKEKAENATKTGNTVIDVVTVMDQFSEDMSEDVEMVTQVITSISMFAAVVLTIFGAYKYFKKLLPKIAKMSKEANVDGFIKKFGEYTKKNELEAVFSSENKIKELKIPEVQKNELLEGHKKFQPIKQKALSSCRNVFIAIATLPIATFIGATLYSAKFQIESSRIARFQARKKLEDPKYFVNYTEEQKAEAKKNLENKPKEEKKGIFSFLKGENIDEQQGFFKNWASLMTQRKAYNEWKKTDTDDSKKVDRTLSAEELKQAKADQDVIQRIVKKINNKAEEYSENMETAASVVIGSSVLLGPLVGLLGNAIVNGLGIGAKISKNLLKSMTDGQLKILKKKLTKLPKGDEKYQRLEKYIQEAEKTIQNEILDKYNKLPKDTKSKEFKDGISSIKNHLTELMDNTRIKTEYYPSALYSIKNSLKTFATGATGRKMMAGGLGMFVGGFIATIVALKLQKAAARAGRYSAREEFRENSQEFLSYNEEELNSVKETTAKKPTMGEKFKEYILFIPTAFKQMYKYENYKKNELKAQKELKEELVKLNIDEKQLQEGQNLQRKVFNTFEKVDEKSQEYSETMEAANEIAQPVILNLGQYIFFTPFVIAGIQIIRGRLSVAIVAQKAMNFLSEKSHWLKSKFVKKHIAQMGDKAIEAINKQEMVETPLKTIFEKIGMPEMLKTGIISISATKLRSALPELSQIINRFDTNNVTERKIFGSVANLIENKIPEELKLMMPELDNLKDFLNRLLKAKSDNELSAIKLEVQKQLLKTIDSFPPEWSNNISVSELKSLFGEFVGVEKINLSTVINKFKTSLSGMDEKTLQETLAKIPFADKLGLDNVSKEILSSNLGKLEKICANMPKEELTALCTKIFNKVLEDPDKFLFLLGYNPHQLKSILYTPQLGKLLATAGISWGAFMTLVTFGLLSYFASLQKEAGRLGVRKALDELKDPAYYGNIIAIGETAKNEPQTQPQAQSTNILERMLGKTKS